MKKHTLLLSITLLISVSLTFAQDKIDKYCQVIVGNKNWIIYTHKSSAKISFGENKWLFNPKDTVIFTQLEYVNSLTTETDVLNYMSKIGWSLVNIHSISNVWEVIYFKKTFNSSDFVQ